MERKITSRRISKFTRRALGDPETHLQNIMKKPILTQRDKQVLLSVYYQRCLTTEQIAELHFRYDKHGNVNTQALVITRRRLRKLFDNGLIDRFFIDVGENNGSSQAHVVLDQLGARVVAGLLNLRMEDIQWRYEMNQTRLPYLEHMVKINQFFIELLRKAREKDDEVVSILTENHVRHEFTYHGKKVVFNPDGYGQYWHGDEGFHFFLELDNGTMTPKTFERKHQRYARYYASGEWETYYENFPLILTVTTSEERAQQLQRTIAKVDNTDTVWLFASEEKIRADVLGAVWWHIRKKDPVSLFD